MAFSIKANSPFDVALSAPDVSVARRDGDHDDRGHHAGALGGHHQAAHRCIIVDRVQPVDVFGRVPCTGKV
jgi:hypothetical protein